MGEQFKKKVSEWIPDTPREWGQIGSSINRLGIAMTAVGAFQDKQVWVLVSLGCTWLGHEVSEYFKIYTAKKQEESSKPE
jgi:hypothetical protein